MAQAERDEEWVAPVPELAFLPSRMPRPLCDFCWAREMADFDPTQYHREHGDRPVMVIGYLEDTGNFEEAIGLCKEHLRALKSFVRGLKWEEPAKAVAGPGHVVDVPVSASEPNPPKAGR